MLEINMAKCKNIKEFIETLNGMIASEPKLKNGEPLS